jgi:hypothetical protein
MTQEEFVAIIKRVVFDPAVGEEALRPAGRKPHEVLVRMWHWYTGLPAYDKAMVRQAMRIPGYGAIFGFFAALDGSRSIDNPPHGHLRLTYIGPDGSEVPLNLTDQVSIQEAILSQPGRDQLRVAQVDPAGAGQEDAERNGVRVVWDWRGDLVRAPVGVVRDRDDVIARVGQCALRGEWSVAGRLLHDP